MKRLTINFVIILSIFLTSKSVNSQCANNANIYTFVYNGKSYEVVKENQTWVNASACAVARGGILAEIDDAAEQNAIYAELTANAGIIVNNTIAPDGGGGSYIWIGGNDLAIEGNWVWDGDNNNVSNQFWNGTASGNPVGGLYNNWGNEPDDFSGQDALGLSLNGWPLGAASQWNDVDHSNTLYYLIEHPSILCYSSSTINETVCESYTSPSGQVWTTSNTYMDTILNAAGCDSIITINLSISTSFSSSTINTCEASYLSPSGQVWSTSNTYMDTIPNAIGCDSILTINLTLNQSTSNTITETACYEYLSPSGQLWTTSNTYIDTITNAAGCDSIITIDLIINTVDISVSILGSTITSNATGATFQWIDCDNGNMPIIGATNQSYTPISNGNYAVEIVQSGCIDTTLCKNVSSLEILDENQNDLISIYPNPSEGSINIQMEANSDVAILITSSTGRIIDEAKNSVFNQNYKYDLSAEPDGVYFLILTSEKGQEIKRLVKTSK